MASNADFSAGGGFSRPTPLTPKPPQAGPKDLYATYPIRLLGFTNEVGAAVAPLIGPVGEMLSYLPALTYIAMDTRDKYYKGDAKEQNKDLEESPSKNRAIEQLCFQLAASVVLPTAAVKASQAFTNKIVDASFMAGTTQAAAQWIASKPTLTHWLDKLKDKPEAANPSALVRFAHGFQKVLDVITVVPLFLKMPTQKSGARNLLLAAVGLTTLGLAIKPIDHFTDEVIIEKAVKPLLGDRQPSPPFSEAL